MRQLAAASGKPAPVINGQIKFGAGNDVLDIRDGAVNGNVSFGGGSNSLLLSGDAVMNGNADFGGGQAVLQLGGTSIFTGNLLNSGGVAASVGAGSTFNATNIGTVALGSLTTGTGVNARRNHRRGRRDEHALQHRRRRQPSAPDNVIAVNLVSVGDVAGTYKIIQAGSPDRRLAALTSFGRLAAVPVRQQPGHHRSQRGRR